MIDDPNNAGQKIPNPDIAQNEYLFDERRYDMCLAAAPAVGNINIGGGNPLVGILVVAAAESDYVL